MVWDPYTKENIKKIEMVQRRAERYDVILCKNYAIEEGCVTEMLQQMGWRSLLQRRVDIRLVFLYKYVHRLVAVEISDDLIPRTRPSHYCNSMPYNIPVETRTYIQKSFLPRTITQWRSSSGFGGDFIQPGHLQRRCLWHHPLILILVFILH